jgi:HEAT repeat protein
MSITAALFIALCSTSNITGYELPRWQGKTAAEWANELESTPPTEANIPVRWFATYALGQLGPDAASALGTLHKTLEKKSEHEYIRGTAAWAIGRIVPEGRSEIDLLRETMHSVGHISVRRNSVQALGNFGSAAHAAVPELLGMLKNDDAVTRIDAAASLWKIDRNEQGVQFLIAAMKDKDPTTAYQACVALGTLVEPPASVAAALVAAFGSPEADVRRAAARSIGHMGAAAFPAFQQARPLDNSNTSVRLATVESLSWMGPIAVRPLTAALKNSVPDVRHQAALALGALGAAAKSAEPELLKTVNDSDEAVAAAAAKALRQVEAR